MNNSPTVFASFGLAVLLAMPGALLAGPGGFANGTAFAGATVGGQTAPGATGLGAGASSGQGGFRGAGSAPAPIPAPAFSGGARSGSVPGAGLARPGVIVPTASSPTFRQRTLPPARGGAGQPTANPAGWPQTGTVARESYLQSRAGRTIAPRPGDPQRTAGQVRVGSVPARGYYRQTDASRPRFTGIPRGVGVRSIDPADHNRRHGPQQRPQYSCPWYYGNVFINGGYGYGYGYGAPYYSYAEPYDYSGLSFTSPEGYYDYSNVPSVEPTPTDNTGGPAFDVPPPPTSEDQAKDAPSAERRTSPGLPPEPNSLVQEVQKELTRRGYFSGGSDGIVTRDFQEALRRFQVDQRLVSSGLINQASLYALGLN